MLRSPPSTSCCGLKLEAFKYFYIPDNELGLSGIVVDPTPELLRLEPQVIDAVTPIAVTIGNSAAFATTPEDPEILPALITYVSEFVPKHSGAAVYQLGHFGTAAKELEEWDLKP